MAVSRTHQIAVAVIVVVVVGWAVFVPSGLDNDGLATLTELQHGTDPLSADTDGDYLRDREEIRGLTDPLKADTDGDGLSDYDELLGASSSTGSTHPKYDTSKESDPLAVDTDGDGINDSRERRLHLHPAKRDADEDGLTDPAECKAGTHPLYADTDGDNLKDGWEMNGRTPAGAPLPDADPFHKDMYLMFTYGKGIEPLTSAQRDRLVDAWADMPVDNPDGTEGIRLHVTDSVHATERLLIYDDGLTEGNVYPYVMNYTSDQLEGAAQLPKGATPPARHDVYFHALVVELAREPRGTTGFGSRGSDTVIVVGKAPGWQFDTEYLHLLTHELLHNVVGRLDPANRAAADEHEHESHSKYDGFLSATHDGEHLPEEIADEIERDGFVYGATSPPPDAPPSCASA
jgi:hypothetical protein